MLALSLGLTVLTIMTAWLLIPVFILPPLAFYYGYKGYKARRNRLGQTGAMGNLLSMVSMLLAAVVFVFGIFLITTQYKA